MSFPLATATAIKHYATVGGSDVDLIAAGITASGSTGSPPVQGATGKPSCFIYVGGGPGDVAVITEMGSSDVFKAVPAGTTIWVRAVKLLHATTTATDLTVGWG